MYKKNEYKVVEDVVYWVSKPKFGREGHGVLFSHDFINH